MQDNESAPFCATKKRSPFRSLLCGCIAALFLGALPLCAQTYVTPKLGGGQVAADMVHIDVYYDAGANVLHAHVDDSYGTPELRALEPGLAFDPQAAYAVLNGKAYNAQYGWNPGGFFTIPAGAAIWIEQTAISPGLEVYEGWGRYSPYPPIFGTAGSPTLWKWSGVMVHNSYAVGRPTASRYYAEYHVYFGDAATGARAGFMQYDDVTVRLEWTTVPVEDPVTFRFGALALTNAAPLQFLNADAFATNSEFVVPLPPTNGGWFEGSVTLLASPATAANGGPATNHAALGACLEVVCKSLSGPRGGQLAFWGANETAPAFSLPVGEGNGTNGVRLSAASGASLADPYGRVPQRLSANLPGLYCLGFQVVDRSTNGPGNGPLHAASDEYCVYLQAGRSIALTRHGASLTSVFAGEPGRVYFLERKESLDSLSPWTVVAGPAAGTNSLLRLADPAPPGARGFYRLRADPLP